jgi:hypothetical protein
MYIKDDVAVLLFVDVRSTMFYHHFYLESC